MRFITAVTRLIIIVISSTSPPPFYGFIIAQYLDSVNLFSKYLLFFSGKETNSLIYRRIDKKGISCPVTAFLFVVKVFILLPIEKPIGEAENGGYFFGDVRCFLFGVFRLTNSLFMLIWAFFRHSLSLFGLPNGLIPTHRACRLHQRQ